MRNKKLFLCLISSLIITACAYGPAEKVHLCFEKNFEGLIQLEVEEGGVRPSKYNYTYNIDVPSSGVVPLKSWPASYQLSGTRAGVAIPAEHSGETSSLPDDQFGLRNLGSTTLGDGTIIIWFFLGTEDEIRTTRSELWKMKPVR